MRWRDEARVSAGRGEWWEATAEMAEVAGCWIPGGGDGVPWTTGVAGPARISGGAVVRGGAGVLVLAPGGAGRHRRTGQGRRRKGQRKGRRKWRLRPMLEATAKGR